MKQLKLIAVSLLAIAFARPAGFCTANTQAEDIASLQEKVAQQEVELAALRAEKENTEAPQVIGTLALLIKGAGLPNADDVLWRIQGGATPEDAVKVALAQIESDKAEEKRAKEKAAAAKKEAK